MFKMNCWDYWKCSREQKSGCPAYPNAGRVCFVVEGTRCDGSMQGAYAQKIGGCRGCEFYKGMIITKNL